MTTVFRQLSAEEEPAGYQVICDTVAWLKRKDIKLWQQPLARSVYAARQQRGENYGLFMRGTLAVIVSLVRGVPEYWAAEAGTRDAVWLCTLATAENFHGCGAGVEGLGLDRHVGALVVLDEAPQVWLDCAPGFLDQLYLALGFARVCRDVKAIPHAGGVFEAVLMRKTLAP